MLNIYNDVTRFVITSGLNCTSLTAVDSYQILTSTNYDGVTNYLE